MQQDPTVCLTPECTLVYPNLFEPSSYKNEEPTYSATFLISKATDIEPLRNAIRAAAATKWGNNVKLSTLAMPVHDGDEKAIDENGNLNKDNFYYNMHYIRAKSKWQPPIVNIYNDGIIDENEIYGGCIVRAYFAFYGYDFMGKLGIGCGLRAVCKIEDGERLGGGRVDTSDVFSSVIQERKESFIEEPPDFNSREYNETGQQNHEPSQEPPGGLEDGLPF
jgi:hypothetical protein